MFSLSRALVLVAASAVLAVGCGDAAPREDRQANVRDRGERVMPFDLDRTTHAFAKTAAGGVETVTVKDAGDADQVPLIRRHLRKEQRLFARGVFRDPAAIHGAHMPGLDVLRTRAERLDMTYRPLPGGAELRFRTTDPAVRDALHDWFDAQVDDHGSDARGEDDHGGHDQHDAHEQHEPRS